MQFIVAFEDLTTHIENLAVIAMITCSLHSLERNKRLGKKHMGKNACI
jgi:predicted nucleic acid-binding OB-fold protein